MKYAKICPKVGERLKVSVSERLNGIELKKEQFFQARIK